MSDAITTEARQQSISAALTAAAEAASQGKNAVESLRWKGTEIQLPVASVDVDLVLLNPPFHVGATVHAGIAHKLFDGAARLLRPGGELWCVWNSHLGYRAALERTVGPTRQVSRGPKFTVTVSTRR